MIQVGATVHVTHGRLRGEGGQVFAVIQQDDGTTAVGFWTDNPDRKPRKRWCKIDRIALDPKPICPLEEP